MLLLLNWLLCQASDTAYPIEKSWRGAGSRIEKPGIQLLGHANEWRAFWRSHAGENSEVPEIDLGKNFVLTVFPEEKCHSISASAETDGKTVTITILLGGKEAAEADYKRRYAILVLARTPLALSVVTKIVTCAAINEKHRVRIETTCSTPNGCHDKCVDEAGTCKSCGKAIPQACDSLCRDCVGDKFCRLCGRPAAVQK